MNDSLFTTRQLSEYREWPDGRKGCLFYVTTNGDSPNPSGIYLMDEEDNPQMREAVLQDPLARSFLEDINPLDNGWHLPQENWVDYMLDLCRKWQARDKQVLKECYGQKRLQEYDDKLRFGILNELEKQYNYWSLRVKLPTEIKNGFIPFFYHYVAAGTIIQKAKLSSDADQVATCFIKYLHRDGELYPVEQLQFDFMENEREWFKTYVEIQLRNLARRTGNNSIYIEESTEWLSNYHRKELLDWELECFEKNKIIFNVLPHPQNELLRNYTKAFFYHMIRHIDFPDSELVDKVKMCLNSVYSKSDLSKELLKPFPDLPFPQKGTRWSKAVYEYIISRKKYDKDFAQYCNNRTLVDICDLLSTSFKMRVDPNTFGKWLNHNRKSIRESRK